MVGVLRFRDPVGKEQQDLARLDPVVIDRKAEILDRAEWRTAFGDELPQAGAAAENEGRIVTGTGIGDLARAEVENSGESGHEDAALALQLRARRRRLPVGLREDAVERRPKCQHGVAHDLFGHRHQQCCRNALARHVGDQKEQAAASSDQQVVVEVSPDHSRRLDAGVDIDVATIGKRRKAPRQQAHLDCLRRGKLALDPLLRLAFANEFRLRGAQVADKHYTQRAEQGQHRKGAVEEEIGKAEEQEFDAEKRRRERDSDSDRAHRPRVAQQPDDREPGRERRSELEPIEKWWAAEQSR